MRTNLNCYSNFLLMGAIAQRPGRKGVRVRQLSFHPKNTQRFDLLNFEFLFLIHVDSTIVTIFTAGSISASEEANCHLAGSFVYRQSFRP